MPEAGPHNQEYTQHHPNAIVDRDLAEDVAHDQKSSYERLARLESLVADQTNGDRAVEVSMEAYNARNNLRVLSKVGAMPKGHESLDPATATDEQALAAEVASRKQSLDARAEGIKRQREVKERTESDEDYDGYGEEDH